MIPFQVTFLYLVHSMRVSIVSTINNLLTVGYVFPAFKSAVVSPHLGEQSQELETFGNCQPVSKHILFVFPFFFLLTVLVSYRLAEAITEKSAQPTECASPNIVSKQ